MKILLPYQDPYNRPLTHSIVSGGTEMFCKSINDNFDVEVLQFESKDTLEKKELYTRKYIQEQQKNIIKKAEECNADVIINNFAWSGFCGSIISKSHILGSFFFFLLLPNFSSIEIRDNIKLTGEMFVLTEIPTLMNFGSSLLG